MKAFEAMERAEQRRKESVSEGREEKPVGSTGTSGGIGGPKRRRRSSSSFKLTANADSNLDISSADESKPEPKRTKRKGRKSNPTTPQRRRSRILSGGTASALSTDEDHVVTGGVGALTDMSSTPGGHAVGPFRFPKTKKSLMTDWLQESSDTTVAHMQNDDDVSANYLRGSRSPPGIATHLLRSTAPLSPVKSVCSAKKRWLRQAISEDHTDEPPVNGNASPSEVCYGDYVTPLKKRRLASYKDDQDHNTSSSASSARMPNGLKKKLLSNTVLEAVLDHALVDMGGGGGSVARSVSTDSMLSPAADSSMSMRSPDQSPAKEPHLSEDLSCSSRDAHYPDDESPDAKHDENESYNNEGEEEEFARCGVEEEEEEEEEDEQVEVEEISSPVANDDEENSQQSLLAEEDDVKEEDEEVKTDEPGKLNVSLPDTHDDDANFAAENGLEGDDDDDKAVMDLPVDDAVQNVANKFEPIDEDSSRTEEAEMVSSEIEEESPLKQRPESPVSAPGTPEVVTKIKMSVTPIKTPEPSSVFKSFFTSNVSIEELEAEIEASQKARLGEEELKISAPVKTSESFLQVDTNNQPAMTTFSSNCDPVSDVSFSSTVSATTEEPEQYRPAGERRISEMSTSNDVHVENHHNSTETPTFGDDVNKNKPKEKKRFSLADYKKRRQTEGIPIQSEPSSGVSRPDDRDGPGTPTLDEELATLAAPPTLNTLPLFEKLEKLEKAQKESKKKGKHFSIDIFSIPKFYALFNTLVTLIC